MNVANNLINIPTFSINNLADLIQGLYIGSNPEHEISTFSPSPESATSSSFCFVFTDKYIKLLNNNQFNAGCYIVPTSANINNTDINIIKVDRPKLTIKYLLDQFAPQKSSYKQSIHPSAIIGENCTIGDNTVIMANVFIGDNCKIGNNCIIHPNAVIGDDGFSFVTERENILDKLAKSRSLNINLQELFDEETMLNNPHLKVKSTGSVIIEDNVEIGANTCIASGTLGNTIIKAGTKIDNLVQIAHNCTIGEDCLIVAGAGIAGSVTLGDRVVIAGHAGIKDGVTIGHDSILFASSHAHRDAPEYSLLGGNPAIPVKDYHQKEKNLRRVMRYVQKLMN